MTLKQLRRRLFPNFYMLRDISKRLSQHRDLIDEVLLRLENIESNQEKHNRQLMKEHRAHFLLTQSLQDSFDRSNADRIFSNHKPTIGLIFIATNKYTTFLGPLIESADRYFLVNYDVRYFVFSDHDLSHLQSARPIVTLKVKHREWPWMTLGRYRIFTDFSEQLSQMDYVFYCDVDMKFVSVVGSEILSDRVATVHPGYFGGRGTPETNPESTAFISPMERLTYFIGAFNGGRSSEFLKMSEELARRIDIDFSKNIIALWHDESHLNRYMLDLHPTKILSPGYCYPENSDLPFLQKIVALVKDHWQIRKE